MCTAICAQEIVDPEAKAILESMKQNMDSYSSVQADFTLIIEFPEEDPERQKGKISFKGEHYKLDMEDQSIICDGNSLWLHLKKRNEVQINNYDADDAESGMFSPKAIFQIYEQDDFVYALTNQGTEDGKKIKQIEFKPNDPNSEYSKLRLTIYAKDNGIKRLKFFGKDGSRYTVAIDNFIADQPMSPDVFVFDASKYPNILVEDLRL